MIDWYLVRNDRRKPDRGTGVIRAYYSRHGIPLPFRDDQARGLGTIEPISEDLAQVLLGLIEREAEIWARMEQEHDHAEEAGEETGGTGERQGASR